MVVIFHYRKLSRAILKKPRITRISTDFDLDFNKKFVAKEKSVR